MRCHIFFFRLIGTTPASVCTWLLNFPHRASSGGVSRKITSSINSFYLVLYGVGQSHFRYILRIIGALAAPVPESGAKTMRRDVPTLHARSRSYSDSFVPLVRGTLFLNFIKKYER
jgi:hypothetical protein